VLLPQPVLNSYPPQLKRCQAVRPYQVRTGWTSPAPGVPFHLTNQPLPPVLLQPGDFVIHFPGSEKWESFPLYQSKVPLQQDRGGAESTPSSDARNQQPDPGQQTPQPQPGASKLQALTLRQFMAAQLYDNLKPRQQPQAGHREFDASTPRPGTQTELMAADSINELNSRIGPVRARGMGKVSWWCPCYVTSGCGLVGFLGPIISTHLLGSASCPDGCCGWESAARL
jgi:hypothetical protein